MAKVEVPRASDDKEYRGFMRAILDDVSALERMIESQKIESGVRRIGAEQEIFLVDRNYRPANLALQMLDSLKHAQFTTELAQFNLECNLTPRRLAGRGLYEMEQELNELLERARKAASEFDARCVLTGILPTLTQSDLGLESMTPIPRYHRLNKVMTDMRGGVFQAVIKGIDELNVKHDNVLFEACNTSFQIHFQSGAEEFPKLYNLAQVITAPVLAAAVNSPVCMQNRLWHESRIALFQQSVDERSDTHQRRGRRPRVSFGDSWVRESVLEIFREDIARFRLVLTTELGETSTAMLDRGEIPPLTALRLHNGTVYRWNRACYGVIDGKPHLRIEVRALPAGPSVVDEVSNAAFFFGLMSAYIEEYKDITQVMSFDDAKDNFFIAARSGLKATFHWFNGEEIAADELILKHLLPRAREGLQQQKVNPDDIERYLGVIEGRVKSGRTGAEWAFDSLASMHEGTRDARYRALVVTTANYQTTGKPVHEWELARVGEGSDWRSSYRTIDQVMTRDVFTVHPEDIVDLAASLMEWEHIRHVPVEDKDGHVVGIVSHRTLMRILASGLMGKNKEPIPVREIMKTGIVTTTSDTSVLDAIALMRRSKVSCLPVVDADQRLIGIVTERDFLDVAAKLFEEQLRDSSRS
ncbi:MAG: CBS domain-containing protein [Planctomycetes bacterium]|nr:CBS domain-containing protein [Planctomycetota bacterium]MCC7171257.1 CBS domain-containing protein [Planctomycetota bacterium]